jgi:acetylornithine deacetylase
VDNDLTALLSKLVAIDSVNPSLVPGGAGEAEAAAFIADWARYAGLEVDVLEETPGRPSALVRARGTGGGRTTARSGQAVTG